MKLEEIIRATLISLLERNLITEHQWPSNETMQIIISDVQEMYSAELDDGQPDAYTEWHDFNPDC